MHLEGELMMHDLYGAHLLNIVLQCCMLFIIIIIIFIIKGIYMAQVRKGHRCINRSSPVSVPM